MLIASILLPFCVCLHFYMYIGTCVYLSLVMVQGIIKKVFKKQKLYLYGIDP